MRALVAILLLAGCDIQTGECTAPPRQWTIPLPSSADVAPSADGTFLMFGEPVLVGNIGRIDGTTGFVTASAPMTQGSLTSDDAGGGVVLTPAGGPVQLVRFAATLAVAWTRMVRASAVDAGPQGDT